MFRRLSYKLGFSIGADVFGYGLIVPHYGTIVVGESNRCGNYCVLHTSTCISDNGKTIGHALYLGTGAKVTSKVTLGDNVSVAANSVVNKSCSEGNVLLAGAPAQVKKSRPAWYIAENGLFAERVAKVEQLRANMFV